MNRWLKKVGPLAVLGGCFLYQMPQANALTATEKMWADLHAADARITASQVTWQTTHIQQPQPTLDIEKMLAGAQAQWRQQGVDEGNFKKLIQAHRQVYERDQAGWQMTTQLSLIHKERATRAETFSGGSTRIGAVAAAVSATPDHIEFYDGQDAASISRALPAAGQADAHPVLVGTLRRSAAAALPHVGVCNLPFLVGAPLFSDYSPTNSALSQAADGTVILEKHVEEDWGQPVPVLYRWTISKQTWRPLLMEQRVDSPKDHNLFRRMRFSEYRKYPGDVWFAAKVANENWGGHSEDAGQKAPTSDEHQLTKGTFNEFADTSLLQHPLPEGAVIDDYRFAPRTSATYRIKERILSDDAVLKLVEQREAGDADAKKVASAQSSEGYSLKQLASLPIGFLLLASGLLLLKGPRRRANP